MPASVTRLVSSWITNRTYVRVALLHTERAAVVIREARARFKENVPQWNDDALLFCEGDEPAELIAASGADVVRDIRIVA